MLHHGTGFMMRLELSTKWPMLLGGCRHTSIKLQNFRQRKKFRPDPQKRIERIPAQRWCIYPRDTVMVLFGPSKGETGAVRSCIRKTNQVIVTGVNMQRVQKVDHDDPRRAKKWVEVEQPLHYSQVSLIDPEDKSPCRVRRRFLESGEKVRVSHRTGAVIERVKHTPTRSNEERMNQSWSPRTTAYADVVERTYVPPP
eukprot:CAMPEP_0119325518 /NCGR_PEP_ID=MMETSP1333-20130426/66030_1 /TAXON_ID=418940 /ORGANISM="Scyphosphaera apsteinii, Strain RCC1455" /LENGTH=197 /DNA_ID=CAMNT_0007333531 /DNA_START=83 /DNA_END=676 /DNA_ORIENTATION=+